MYTSVRAQAIVTGSRQLRPDDQVKWRSHVFIMLRLGSFLM